jgi:hypothetical protein
LGALEESLSQSANASSKQTPHQPPSNRLSDI